MNIKKYFSEIQKNIEKINSYITNPINYKEINNPFKTSLNKTYVWIEENGNKYKNN